MAEKAAEAVERASLHYLQHHVLSEPSIFQQILVRNPCTRDTGDNLGANWSFVGSRLLAALSLCPCVVRLRVSPARVFVLDKVAFYTSANTTYHGLLPSSQLQIEGVTSMADPQVHFCLGLRRSLKAPFF